MILLSHIIFALPLLSPGVAAVRSSTNTPADLSSLSYVTYPKRKPHEAAIIEWGNSAVISALDAAVATFGPQTSRGAFFEVETAPILANPIDGSSPVTNTEEWTGNMVVMTNSDPQMTPVQMALKVQEEGGAALMIVNTQKEAMTSSDFIYSVAPQEGEEEDAKNVDIPVIMVSLSSGNLLSQAGGEGDEAALPERVRLYAAEDRPFFEDLSTQPILYLIHNALTEEECDELVASAKNKVFDVEKEGNVLEGYNKVEPGSISNTERVYLWKGLSIKGPMMKSIDERFETVSGYPKEHLSDFQINRVTKGGKHDVHNDDLPPGAQKPLLTFIIFLTDVEDGEGGELVYPQANEQAIKVLPRKGMAVVHQNYHNEKDELVLDTTTSHAELTYTGNEKWIAKRWIYMDQVSNNRRMVLPILAAPFGGRLPRLVVALYNELVQRFGYETGGMYFDKTIMILSAFILLRFASWIGVMVQKGMFGDDTTKTTNRGGKKVKQQKTKTSKKKN